MRSPNLIAFSTAFFLLSCSTKKISNSVPSQACLDTATRFITYTCNFNDEDPRLLLSRAKDEAEGEALETINNLRRQQRPGKHKIVSSCVLESIKVMPTRKADYFAVEGMASRQLIVNGKNRGPEKRWYRLFCHEYTSEGSHSAKISGLVYMGGQEPEKGSKDLTTLMRRIEDKQSPSP